MYGEEGGLKGQGNSLLMFYTFRRRDCLHKFMVVLCERGETRRLIEYPFINLQDEVLDTECIIRLANVVILLTFKVMVMQMSVFSLICVIYAEERLV